MKLITTKELISVGGIKTSEDFLNARQDVKSAIMSVSWADQHKFLINPTKKGNGVVPIKTNFVAHLVDKKWQAEARMSIVKGLNPGPIDAVKTTESGIIAVEWETGNISSSHRALNKIAVGILQDQIIAGFLVLPHKVLAQFLTDRIGNYEELEPYFPMYANLNIDYGHIEVFGVEHDGTSESVILIPKGKDGNAKKGK